ncbi:quinone oxidoreductase-like protein 1 isoform X2 [Saccopteryx bilineata]|uniref:quinone oxidoreductase-like protein 1 isoform X2 n=1 Tax=Saccopteryx bilineata TaxID=59482 RepID=UPI00338F4996
MKGLYFQQSSTNEEITFVFQERLLAELKMEKDLFPVGREIAGIVLDEPARQSTCRWRPPPPLTASAVVLLFSWSNSYLVYTMKIKLVGSKVSFFQPDDEVVGILPLDTEDPGLCEVVRVHEHYLVHKPEKVTWAEAAGTVRDGVRAYTALHYLSHLSPGKSVLIMDGASALGTIAVQLAHHRGAKVISTAHSLEDKQYLERLRPSIARIIDVSNGKAHVVESCLEETGGLGVDIVLDAGVKLYSKDDEPAEKLQLLPHKHDILTLLGVGGHWVTTEEHLQLDPPDSHCLFLKGATVAFLNDEVWNLSNVQQGKYLCILKDVMEKLSTGVFRPRLDEPIPLYEAKVTMEVVQKNQGRKKQVVQF